MYKYIEENKTKSKLIFKLSLLNDRSYIGVALEFEYKMIAPDSTNNVLPGLLTMPALFVE